MTNQLKNKSRLNQKLPWQRTKSSKISQNRSLCWPIRWA